MRERSLPVSVLTAGSFEQESISDIRFYETLLEFEFLKPFILHLPLFFEKICQDFRKIFFPQRLPSTCFLDQKKNSAKVSNVAENSKKSPQKKGAADCVKAPGASRPTILRY